MGETSTGATPRAGSAAAGTEAGRPLSRAQSTRQALLKAAQEVFSEEGYAAAAVAEVVRRADASVGGLYHHFGGKVDLFLALWEDFRRAQIQAAAQRVAGLRKEGETRPRELFLAGTRAYLEHTWARRDVAKLFYVGDHPPGFHLLGRQNSREWIRQNGLLLGTHERPGERALLVVLTTTIAETGRDLVTCDNPLEAAELTDAAVELIGRLYDFGPLYRRRTP